MLARAISSATTWARGGAAAFLVFGIIDILVTHRLPDTTDLTLMGSAAGALGFHVAYQAGTAAGAPRG